MGEQKQVFEHLLYLVSHQSVSCGVPPLTNQQTMPQCFLLSVVLLMGCAVQTTSSWQQLSSNHRRSILRQALLLGGLGESTGWRFPPSNANASPSTSSSTSTQQQQVAALTPAFDAYQVLVADSPRLEQMTVRRSNETTSCRRRRLEGKVPRLDQLITLLYRVLVVCSCTLVFFVKSDSFWTQLASSTRQGALWLGEHHNSVRDHNLQASILRQLYDIRKRQKDGPMAIGLEQVQVKFQSVLDDYIAKRISADEMRQRVEWDRRWLWSFEGYEPIFAAARELGVPLIALNVNSEDLALVERSGLPGLTRDQLQQYIPDGAGFAAFARQREFSAYVDYVIRPSYDIHAVMGLLRNTIAGERLDQDMPFVNFLSGRILWDEAMSANAYRWTSSHPGGLLLGLVGADHVKFRNGIPGRYARQTGGTTDCVSILLNPTLIDTRPSGSVANLDYADSTAYPDRLTLQLRYLKEGVDPQSPERSLAESTGGFMPLADYLLIG